MAMNHGANSFRVLLARAAGQLRRAGTDSILHQPGAAAGLIMQEQSVKYMSSTAAGATSKLSVQELERLQRVAAAAGNKTTSAAGSTLKRTGNTGSSADHQFHWIEPASYPLLGMLSIALGLAVMTMYREIADSPTVLIDKRKRVGLVEMDDPEWTSKKGEHFATTSPLKNIFSSNSKIPAEKTTI
jgi:hypothetical protein